MVEGWHFREKFGSFLRPKDRVVMALVGMVWRVVWRKQVEKVLFLEMKQDVSKESGRRCWSKSDHWSLGGWC
jgi:hypothetical protein